MTSMTPSTAPAMRVVNRCMDHPPLVPSGRCRRDFTYDAIRVGCSPRFRLARSPSVIERSSIAQQLGGRN
jgi:hypothetical protein